jgi:galactose mutarotase-like enzyme
MLCRLSSEKYVSAYQLSLVSADGDQNYPGELSVQIIYGLTEQNEFCIEYSAETNGNYSSKSYIASIFQFERFRSRNC